MPHTYLAGERRSRRCTWWTVGAYAVVLLAIGSGGLLVATADPVPKLTSKQEQRSLNMAIGHHSFAPPLLRQYYGDDDIPHWSIIGSSVITDDYVRLTGDQKGQVGHLWNTEPLDMDAFEIVVGFWVHRPVGGDRADGFGVWVAQPPRFDGAIFGRPPTFSGFGILFDSYDNDKRRDNPMVSLVYNDGSSTKRFDPDKDFMGDSVASCVFDYLDVSPPDMATMRMVYLKGELQLHLSKNSEATETECLRVTKLPLPAGKVHLSFSAQTGDVSGIHDILFVHLSPLMEVKYDHDVQQTMVPPSERHDAQLYNNDAMNNRPIPEETQPAPQETQSAPQETQSAPQETQPAPQETQSAPQETQPAPQETQPAPQETQPSTQPSTDPGLMERQRIEELERKLEELQRRNEGDEDEDEYEDYDDDGHNKRRRVRRVRRARTPRRNRDRYDD
ncbi:Legumelike lectin family [Leishmania braziliensis]|nr:Legumelike lectin family [Leishmania braziliensis]